MAEESVAANARNEAVRSGDGACRMARRQVLARRDALRGARRRIPADWAGLMGKAHCLVIPATLAAQLLWGFVARAESSHLENRCPRLSPAAYEELDARVQLLLQGREKPSPPPAVVCDGASAWVEWAGQRLEVPARTPLADEFVEVIEAHLNGEVGAAPASSRGTEAKAVASRQPLLPAASEAPLVPPTPQPAARMAQRAEDARGGGVALGVQIEPPSESRIRKATRVRPGWLRRRRSGSESLTTPARSACGSVSTRTCAYPSWSSDPRAGLGPTTSP